MQSRFAFFTSKVPLKLVDMDLQKGDTFWDDFDSVWGVRARLERGNFPKTLAFVQGVEY